MKKIFITGVSGTGKTTIWKELLSRGINAISLDEVPGLCVWRNKESGVIVNYEALLNKEFIDTHEWICDTSKLSELINSLEDNVVVLGSATNQNEFINWFDKVVVLQCAPETFIERIMQRTDNDFGKNESAQKVILNWYQKFESDLLENGAISISVEKPLDEVVDEVIALL